MHGTLRTHIIIVADVEKVREVERVVPVEGRIRVGGARATGGSFLFFFLFFCFNC